MVEKVVYGGETLALIIRGGYSPEGVNFVTSSENYLQVGVLVHGRDKVIKPHVHKEIKRIINFTQEVLHVEYGEVEAVFYSDNKKVEKRLLYGGDTIVLVSGGHGFKILEETKIIEVKQGPYISPEKDKEAINI